MLVLKRKEGQWITITHESGDILRIRVTHTNLGSVKLLCVEDDGKRNFDIQRVERQYQSAD